MNADAISPEVLNRLLIGRELLRSYGPNLTSQSSALAVARAILTAQDAAELIGSAISEHILAEHKDRAGLPEYLDGIEKKTGSNFPGRSFFNSLNRARVSFKHHGTLPNVPEFHRVLTRAEDHLDQACSTYLGVSLSRLDLSLLIADLDIRRLYVEAQDLARDRKYRETLETLARALNGFGADAPLYISAGDSDSEVALQLTAYGVDAGAFIRMQQFLPTINTEEIKWDTRNRGHPGNWTRRNIDFCLSTFLDMVLKLQHADYQPSAVEFSFLFDDVLTVKRDGVWVQSQYYHPFLQHFGDTSRDQKLFGELKIGQRVRGRLIPAFQTTEVGWEECSFDVADVYVMQHPKIDVGTPVPPDRVLILKAEDVDWSFEARESVRRHWPHLFDPEPAEEE